MKVTATIIVSYILFAAIGVLLSGAGHGPGIRVLFYLAFPLSLLGDVLPTGSPVVWVIVLGFVQWVLLGLAADIWRKRLK